MGGFVLTPLGDRPSPCCATARTIDPRGHGAVRAATTYIPEVRAFPLGRLCSSSRHERVPLTQVEDVLKPASTASRRITTSSAWKLAATQPHDPCTSELKRGEAILRTHYGTWGGPRHLHRRQAQERACATVGVKAKLVEPGGIEAQHQQTKHVEDLRK